MAALITDMTTPNSARPFCVRPQTSDGVTQYVVVKTHPTLPASRLVTEPLSRKQANAKADRLNIGLSTRNRRDERETEDE